MREGDIKRVTFVGRAGFLVLFLINFVVKTLRNSLSEKLASVNFFLMNL